MVKELILIIISNLFINNFVLGRFLGLCAFFGISNKMETSLGMGMAVTFVSVFATVCTWAINTFILVPFDITYLQTITFILIIAALVQFVEMVIQKSSPVLYQALGIYLPLITTNCMILGLAILVVNKDFDLIRTVIFSFSASVGYTLSLIMLAGIREKLDLAPIPKPFQGISLAMITASIFALAFMGFSGLVKG